jgi:outer membrane murein-binding lipoprotein Lpp
MAEFLILVVVIAAIVGVAVLAGRRNQTRQLEQRRSELEPVKKLANEDVTALGTDLQDLDSELLGTELDAGARADYQRALDAYESAKTAADAMTQPDDVRHVTEIIEDGRYAIACVRARVAGEDLPTRRPPCFFDPRHGLSVGDVDWAPPGGTPRTVPACQLDLERVRAGAEPDTRQVMVGAQRMPYYQGGPAYQPYAQGYFGAFSGMNMMFTGLLLGSMMSGGWGDGWGDGGDMGGDGGGDMGGGDGGGGDGGFWGDFGGGDGGGFDFGGGDF